jgi:hypothetical protein
MTAALALAAALLVVVAVRIARQRGWIPVAVLDGPAEGESLLA